MVNELQILYNTLMTIETKGENTKIMAQCLTYTKQLITKSIEEDKAKAVKVSEEGDK